MNVHAELAKERRARLAAERLLKLRQEELAQANAQLGKHANALTEEVIEQREEAEEWREKTDQALQDLKVAKSEIHIAKRRLWDSIETIEDGFAVFDENHEMIVANSAYLSVFDDMPIVGPGAAYADLVAILLEEGIVDIGEETPADWRTRLLDRWQQPKPEPLVMRLWNGRFVKLIDRHSTDGDTVSLALDITDTIRNQKRLERATERAQAANRAKSAFLARMSHELRTPMNGVVGMAELLHETNLTEEQAQFVETIQSSGTALLDLINDVLDFSKLEATKVVLVEQTFSLRELTGDMMRLFAPAVQGRPVQLTLDIEDNVPDQFTADQGRVRQVLTNLIGNSVKFTDAGEVKIEISAGGIGGDGLQPVTIVISDTGIGIPADRIDYIFGEFNQVDDEKNRKFEGTGLGLAITKQLVELMGGKVDVTSVAGEGSTFTVVLNMRPAAEATARGPEKVPTPQSGQSRDLKDEPVAVDPDPADISRPAANDAQPNVNPRRMRILAAEDNKTNRFVFQKMVKTLNIDLEFAENGREALEAWRNNRHDLIFMDISMPEMDGKEATLRIRREEAEYSLPRTPICALTAHAMSGDEKEILAAGLDHYLTKPLKKDKIFEQIRLASPDGVEPVFEEPDAAHAPTLLMQSEPREFTSSRAHIAAQ